MTREEAMHIVDIAFGVPQAVRRAGENRTYHEAEIRKAKEMAIKALEQEPCEDAISRQAALDVIAETDITNGTEPVFTGKQVQALLWDLPSVTPKPKTGHWIWCVGSHKCSNCELYTCFSHKEMLRYCPNCGAKMESEEV